ncbi:thiosulfate:glutathione sulfurtransferase [Salarias fasciatus]|uniref:Thiosulfate:glutathione sulfurtransferase-like n=1 Tax=Salarias fasciatus TaxID=181472 RepID=A0A672J2T2_SALFA|nr:thiosulfate:glutathione sulfurtransferase-like [Salarias fasciatus]
MAQTETKEIFYDELKELVGKSQNLFLVDVRSKEEYDKGYIPGSVHIPVDTVEAALSLNPEEFKAKYGVTKPQVVFHCQMGRRGGIATNKATEMGYKNARNFIGGYKKWAENQGK